MYQVFETGTATFLLARLSLTKSNIQKNIKMRSAILIGTTNAKRSFTVELPLLVTKITAETIEIARKLANIEKATVW
jgi:hypothetical protein